MFRQLSTLCQSIYHSRFLRIGIASLFSAGKILSSAGATLFGVKETLTAYGIENATGLGISSSLTGINILLTSANRAPPIFRKLLKNSSRSSSLALTTTPPDYNPILEVDEQPDLESDDTIAPPSPQASPQILPSPSPPPPDTTNRRLAVSDLSLSSKGLYYLLNFLCCLSLPFSALNAYLSAITLVNEVYNDLSYEGRLAFANFVTASSMMSYCTFNLSKMRHHVLRFCAGIDYRFQHGSFDLQTKTVIATLVNTLFGIIAGVGTSYLGTEKSLELFPLTKDASAELKKALIISSCVASLFSSTFIYASSCYDLIKRRLEPHAFDTTVFPMPWYIKTTTFIDSTSNSTTGYLGIRNLLSHLSDQNPNKAWIIVLALLPLCNNVFMNYSLGLVGCEPAAKWLEAKQAQLSAYCCPPNTSTALHQPLLDEPNTQDIRISISQVATPTPPQSGHHQALASQSFLKTNFSPLPPPIFSAKNAYTPL